MTARPAYRASGRGTNHDEWGARIMCGNIRIRGAKRTTTVLATRRVVAISAALAMILGLAGPARAGKLSWLDDVVQEVIVEAKSGGKGLVREVGGDGARLEARRGGPAVPVTRGRRGARAPGPAERGARRRRSADRAAGRGPARVAIRPADASGPAGLAHLRRAAGGREAAGRRAGRDGAAPGSPISGRGRDDGPPARVPRD